MKSPREAYSLRSVVVAGDDDDSGVGIPIDLSEETIEELHRLPPRIAAIKDIPGENEEIRRFPFYQLADLCEKVRLFIEERVTVKYSAKVPVGGMKHSHRPQRIAQIGEQKNGRQSRPLYAFNLILHSL